MPDGPPPDKRRPPPDGPPTNKVFIGGLTQNTTIEMIEDHFCQYGKITDSVVMKDRDTGRSRGFGFVQYDSESPVDDLMRDYEKHKIDGKWVEVKRATPQDRENRRGRGDRDRGDRGRDRDRDDGGYDRDSYGGGGPDSRGYGPPPSGYDPRYGPPPPGYGGYDPYGRPSPYGYPPGYGPPPGYGSGYYGYPYGYPPPSAYGYPPGYGPPPSGPPADYGSSFGSPPPGYAPAQPIADGSRDRSRSPPR